MVASAKFRMVDKINLNILVSYQVDQVPGNLVIAFWHSKWRWKMYDIHTCAINVWSLEINEKFLALRSKGIFNFRIHDGLDNSIFNSHPR